jgi:hypothetical protein
MAQYFQLLEGCHVQDDPSGKVNPTTGMPFDRMYRKGEIFESQTDLVARFNSPGSAKFQRVLHNGAFATPEQAAAAGFSSVSTTDQTQQVNPFAQRPDETPAQFKARMQEFQKQAQAAVDAVTPPDATLASMSVAELQATCKEEGIDFKNSSDKKELVKMLKSFYGS